MYSSIQRRTFLKDGALVLGAAAIPGLGTLAHAEPDSQKAPVYFTRDISVDGLLKVYSKVNAGITGKVGIKLHTGEPHGPNILPLPLIKGLQAQVPDSTIVECNVLYPSPRQTTSGHRDVLKTNGFDFCPVDIMDAEGDASLPVPGMKELLANQPARYTPGRHLEEVAVGKDLLNYDSLLVYTHFKGHTMGGFGGSLKNIAIGCASGQGGKLQIHDHGWPKGPLFLERMVESGAAVRAHFGQHITYVNVLKNLSVDCDCDAHGAKPTCPDIGILASTDLLAIDQAAIDLVYKMPEKDRHDLVERIETRTGLHQLEYMKTLQMGTNQYRLIEI